MQIRGIQVQRRPGSNLGPVQLLAVGRRPEPRLLARGLAVRAPEGLQERLVGRPYGPADGGDQPVPVRGRRRRHGDCDRRLFVRNGEQPLQLADDPLGHDPGRGQPARQTFPGEFGDGRHVARVVVDARQEAVETLGRVGPLEGRQQRHHRLRPLHLVDRLEPVDALILLLQLGPADDRQDVERDRLLDREARAAVRSGNRAGGDLRFDRVGRVERLAEEPPRPVPPLRARVVEAIVVLIVAQHRRRDRRQLEQAVPEPFGQLVDGVGCVADLAHWNLLAI